ncbi:MAG: hypothetical protein IPP88_22115 [Betaproteobacteria bacterium]|nr:hypothetical protein [Betaproteobacteria bacterium]
MISRRNGSHVLRRRTGILAIMLAGIAALSHADSQVGLDARVSIGAYMNGMLPATSSDPMPATLTLTGVFTDVPARTPHPGFMPYDVNSPLWTDGAEKSRFIAIPFNSSEPTNPVTSPRIGFAANGSWSFPNGTVIIKNFDMRSPGAAFPVRRLETRVLVRNADGSIRGATYRWIPPVQGVHSEAELVSAPLDETLVITEADGSTRNQVYSYPGPDDCVRCHNSSAGMVLGIRTAQLNGDFTYQSTGRTDNQLHTWDLLGMLDTPLNAASTYPRAVAIDDVSAPLEHRVRSYLSSNCAHCHQPGGGGPIFDMRFETPTQNTNLIGPFGGLIRDDLANSRLYVRDSALPGNFPGPMPPLARNIPDPRILNLYDQWVNYSYDVISATRLSPTQIRLLFNRAVEAVSATTIDNYAIDNGASITLAVADTDPAAVILTTTPLTTGASYSVTINNVRELAAPRNLIWPNTTVSFPTVPDAPALNGIQAGNGMATLSFLPPAFDGGAPITGYAASCTSAILPAVTGSGTDSPIVVTGLANGSRYSCAVIATNSIGSSTASNIVVVTPFSPAPLLTGVVSRKAHGNAGPFDLPIDSRMPISGNVTVEPRHIGNGHQVVFQFDTAIIAAGNAMVTSGNAIAQSAGSEVIVTLSGVADAQRVTISLTGVNGAGTASASIGFLVGDVNITRRVDAADASAIKARTGQRANAGNYFYDLNASGVITVSDVSAAKARSGGGIP